jgi:hypothetical protein
MPDQNFMLSSDFSGNIADTLIANAFIFKW